MKPKRNNSSFIIYSSLAALTGMICLFYSKYDLNELSLADVKFDYIGNILDLAITVLIIVGNVSLGFSKKNIEKGRFGFILTLMFLNIVFIIAAYIITKFNLFNIDGYLFNITYKKVITGFLFIIAYFTLFYSLFYSWGLLFGRENLYELRTLIRTLSASVILFVFALFFVWNLHSSSVGKNSNKKYEYGFIPGAAVYSKGKPSPIFAARIKKAHELINKGRIDKLILTGGNAPGEITEAEAAFKYLVNLGVKPDRLILEKKTSTTVEQIKYIKSNLMNKKEGNEILIISDGFHLSRTNQICKFFGVKASGVSSGYLLSLEKTIFYKTRESIALLLFWFFAI